MDVWSTIDSYRQREGITDRELSRRLGKKSHSYVYNLRNALRNPSTDVADRMVELLREAGFLATVEEQLLFWKSFMSLRAAREKAAA